jgi:thiamine-phosphate pyrophosphorylase
MTDTVRAQLYLMIGAGDADALPALLAELPVACVRMRVTGAADAEAAQTCRLACHEREIPLVIAADDDEMALDVAEAAQADGVHLAGSPKAGPWVRERLGEDAIVGIDPGPSRHDAMTAAEHGADYVTLHGEWGADGAVPEEILWWSQMIETPMVVEAGSERAGALSGVAEFVAAGMDDARAVAAALEG